MTLNVFITKTFNLRILYNFFEKFLLMFPSFAEQHTFTNW
jgi:hypothetical protein